MLAHDDVEEDVHWVKWLQHAAQVRNLSFDIHHIWSLLQ